MTVEYVRAARGEMYAVSTTYARIEREMSREEVIAEARECLAKAWLARVAGDRRAAMRSLDHARRWRRIASWMPVRPWCEVGEPGCECRAMQVIEW